MMPEFKLLILLYYGWKISIFSGNLPRSRGILTDGHISDLC